MRRPQHRRPAATATAHASARGSSAAPMGSSRSSAGVPAAMTWPQWITEIRSARPNRKRMSCSMTTIVSCRFSSPTSSASRAVASAPSPAVGSSRNSRRGSAASATRDLERAPLAVGQALRAAARSLPARPTLRQHRRPPAARRAESARRSRQTSKPRAAHARQRDQHVVERRVVVEQVHDWNEREMPLRAISARRQAGDVVAGEAHRAAVGRVAAGEHVEAGGLAGAVRTHDPRQLALLERERSGPAGRPGRRSACAGPLASKRAMQRPPSPRRGMRACAGAAPRAAAGAPPAACHMPAMPSGLNSTMATNSSPYQSSQVSV